MSSLLPIRSEPSTGDEEPRVVDLSGEDAEEVFSALSSSTAREIVAALHEEPRTQSEISEELDTTVQNVRYHLDKLEDAGLVEVVDTWYSSRGNEMSVYAPADGALIVSGDEREASRLRNALSRLVGGVAVIGLAGLLVQFLFGDGPDLFGSADVASGPAAGGAGDAPATGDTDVNRDVAGETRGGYDAANGTNETVTPVEATPTPDPTTVGDAAANGADAAGSLPPGLLFFLGGLSVLVVVVGLAYWSGR